MDELMSLTRKSEKVKSVSHTFVFQAERILLISFHHRNVVLCDLHNLLHSKESNAFKDGILHSFMFCTGVFSENLFL